jgi:hypothetical protein
MEVLKPVPKKNKGLSKLPTPVRNKMGFKKKGGAVAPKKMKGGGGLYANIHAKRKRIAAGSKEKMRKPGSKGAPTAANFKRAAKTAKKK